MKNITLIGVWLFLLVSCNKHSSKIETVLDNAGDNKEELQKVLTYYKNDSADSLKYKAAVFLIESMDGHSSYKILPGFEGAFNKISNYPMNDDRKEIFRKIFDSVSTKVISQKAELIPDCQFVTSKYLINTIELSFKAWDKIPKEKKANFADFCNYILPYKTGEEPIEEDTREKLIKKYSWVYKSLESKVSLRSIVDSIASQFGHASIENMKSYYNVPLSISQVEKSRVGSCDDGVNYIINVFRSLGIISAKDMIPHWGNHHSLGHSWIYVKYGSEEYSTDVRGKVDLKSEYVGESIPKVLRVMYSRQDISMLLPFSKDVTIDYVPTVDCTIDNVLNAPSEQAVLCVFDVNNVWIPVATGKQKDNSIVFSTIGVNVLYMAGVMDGKEFIPVNYPFYIDKNKKYHFFKPTKGIQSSAALLRKYGLSCPKSTRNIDWMNNLNDCVFQGANNFDFSDAKTLYHISNFNSTHINKIQLKLKDKFKYVRFYSNQKESYLAKLAFYGADGKQLEGIVFEKNNTVFKWTQGAFDDNPLSFSGGKEVSLGLEFTKPQVINWIEFQVRNDGNHINIGDQYELFYWNRSWKTLGKQIAKDTVLYYNTPKNALFWLRNLTKGKEEHVFMIDKNKKQRWLGFDNY
ncbi:hypothetical protein SAMN06265349_10799 [Flavobacterium resistens]|uniref:Peptide-N(4)-(N-acetyl-beta-glucosaminyl)asparagine amidase n=1 Tax=Flavobacterium resistens TaxID=443612 RepID=A0A521F9J1_9FLAO|nr:hypothetical protein [Flavobacterium resistens]MRX70064.1 hypothetical protein [Flavobacterium resistens]SMO92885.1 hypothetical protein SAMN06265349_10799 [Flavobacterium resistens]